MKLKTLLFGLSCMFLIAGCGGDDEKSSFKCKDCADAPEADAAHDASSKGIYKGVVVGSSGVIKFDVANDGGDITATLTIDGKTVNLTSNVQWDAEETLIATFTGTLNDQAVSLTLYVDPDGTDVDVEDIIIPGHPGAVIVVVKEKSDELVKCFEGRYKGDATGNFNLVLSEDVELWYAIARSDESGDPTVIYGFLDGSEMAGGDNQGDIIVVGRLEGDEVSGNWESDEEQGRWEGKRTL